MRPIGPLHEAQLAFADFQVTSNTVASEEVQVTKYVRFEAGCSEEALETLDAYIVWYDLKDELYGYYFVRQVVPGPITDGNNVQMIDDCKIVTVTNLEPYIEGETNRLKMAPEKTQTAQLTTTTPSEAVQIKTGCHSEGSSSLLILMIAILTIQKTKSYFFGSKFFS